MVLIAKGRAKAKAGKPTRRAAPPKNRIKSKRRVLASYDAAASTVHDDNHWANADSLAASLANDPLTRQTLRDRSRYECANNCYAAGLVESLANDLVGTGPRLQLTLPDGNRENARAIESAFANWSRACDLAGKLRVLHSTRIRDGECFALFIDNPLLPSRGLTSVTLDLMLYEAEQVHDPLSWGNDPFYIDGIRRDGYGNAIEYTFLKSHPGGINSWMSTETEKFPANRVIHWFRPNRPGQVRGVPTITPGLPLFAQLRRYTLATLGAAELAAMLAGVMKTTMPAEDGSPVTVSSMDEIELAKNALLTLPQGWDATQFKPEQPVAQYADFKGQLLNEIGRSAQVPFNVIAGNSSGYNYSSGRLDHLLYHRSHRVERSGMRCVVLDRVFPNFIEEAALARAIPPALPPIQQWAWDWHWDGFDSIDPEKDAKTDEIELRTGTTTYAAIYARKGQDWEEQFQQQAREKQLRDELGLKAPVAAPAQPAMEVPDEEEELANAA